VTLLVDGAAEEGFRVVRVVGAGDDGKSAVVAGCSRRMLEGCWHFPKPLGGWSSTAGGALLESDPDPRDYVAVDGGVGSSAVVAVAERKVLDYIAAAVGSTDAVADAAVGDGGGGWSQRMSRGYVADAEYVLLRSETHHPLRASQITWEK